MEDNKKDQAEQEEKAKAMSTVVVGATAVVAAGVKKPGIGGAKIEKTSQMREEQFQQQQNQNFKKLIQGMSLLAERMKPKKATVAGKASGEKGELGILGALKKTVGEMAGGKVKSIKSLFTKTGALDALAGVTGGGLISTALGSASEKMKNAKQQEVEKQEWVKNYLESSRRGKKSIKDLGEKEAKKQAEALFEEKGQLEDRVKELKEKQTRVQTSGIHGADLSTEEKKELTAAEKRLDIVQGGPLRTAAVKKPEKSDSGSESAKANPTQGKIAPMDSTNEDSSELLSVNKEQLNTLKKILKSSVKTKEEILEEGKTSAIEETPAEKKAEKKEEKSLLSTLIENLPGPLGKIASVASSVAGNIATKVAPLASTAASTVGAAATKAAPFAKAAAPILAKGALVGAAGYAGYKAGGLLNEYVLDPLAEKATGEEGATVGTAIYSGVDKVQGMLGFKTDADKMRESETAAAKAEFDKKIASGEKVNQRTADFFKEKGFEFPADRIRSPNEEKDFLAAKAATATPTAVPTAVPTATAAQSVTAVPTAAPRIEAPTIARAEQQTNLMNERQSEVSAQKKQPQIIQVTTPAPISSGGGVSTNTTIVRPDLRSPEPTFNKILTNNFTFS